MCARPDSSPDDAVREAVRSLLLAALPLKSAETTRLVEALAAFGGLVSDAGRFAAVLEMGSRYRVARMLRREALPQLEELAGWVRLIRWLVRWEASPGSLSRMALDDGLETSVCCRTVRRLTGTTWTEARARGSAWAILLLSERCRALARRWEPLQRTG